MQAPSHIDRRRLVDDAHAPAWWSLASPDNHGVDIAAWADSSD